MPYARRDTICWESGQYYHLYNRGTKKTLLFLDQDNYLYVQRKIGYYCNKYQLSMIAYCLMPNHYHFLVRQDAEYTAGKLPQYVFNGYTKAYNRRYGTSGTLFERRYQVKQIKLYSHLLHLCRYIHANPVKDGIVASPDDWLYSNYLEWIAERDNKLFNRKFIQENYGSSDDYKAFVIDYLETFDLPDELESYLAVFDKK